MGKKFHMSFPKEFTSRASQSYKTYMQIYVVLFNHAHSVKIYIFYFVMMIIVEEHEYTF
jgi:hypothetical protein